jgi:hypothetical protein
MNQHDIDIIAKDINTVTAALAKVDVLKTASPQGCAMALALASAAHVLHNGGSENDYMNLVRAAWARAREQHKSAGTK